MNPARSRERSSATQIARTADGNWSADAVTSSSMRDELLSFIRRRGDEVLAAAITAGALVEIVLLDKSAWARLAYAAGALALGAAAARRVRMPLLFLGLIVGISVAAAILPQSDSVEAIGLFVLLAVYSAAANTSGRRTQLAGGLTV